MTQPERNNRQTTKKHISGTWQKRVALLMVAIMLCCMLPTTVYVQGSTSEYLCGHIHDESCGYSADSEGSPCLHEHDESCYTLGCSHICEHTCTHICDENCETQELTCTHVCGDECQTQEPACTHICGEECVDGCLHVCDDGCYTTVTQCVHSHDDTCYTTAPDCTHVHDESCGGLCDHICDDSCQMQELTCVHIHDDSCGYAEPVPGTPCSHICEILSFNDITSGSAIGTYHAGPGETYGSICGALPETLSGVVACSEDSVDIPVRWVCPDFIGEEGTYIFRAELTNEHCAFNVTDDELTEDVDESELPFIEVTVPEQISEVVPLCTCTEKCTAESINIDCPVCAGDYTACEFCEAIEDTEQIDAPLPVSEPEEKELSKAAEDGAIVRVSGLLPVGAELAVTAVPVEDVTEFVGEGAEVLFAYDIKIMIPETAPEASPETASDAGLETVSDAAPETVPEAATEMVEYQPTGPVSVSITPPEDKPIESAVEVTHVTVDTKTGASTPQAVPNVVTTGSGTVEFEADGFSVYVVTMGTYTPRVTFNYDDTAIDVEYSTTKNGTYTTLDGDVSVEAGTVLYFKVTGGTVAGVYRDGSSTSMTADGSGVYTLDDISADTTIHIGARIKFDLSNDNVLIGQNENYSGKDSSGNVLAGTHNDKNEYVVTQSGSETVNFISLIGNSSLPTYDLTLSNLNCGSPQNKKDGGIRADALAATPMKVILRLEGSNSVGRVHYATGEATENSSSSLYITSASGDGSTEGGLTAYSSVCWSAAIGGIDATTSEASRNITIAGGTVIATTTNGSHDNEGTSAIGGGGNGASDVAITGGHIIASNCGTGATIGGGGGDSLSGGKGVVNISNGVIIATNNYVNGVAIGGGGSKLDVGSQATVTISGGNITATGSIGGGYSEQCRGGDATVEITGGIVSTNGLIGGGNSLSSAGGTANISIGGGTISASDISGGQGYGGTYAIATLSVTGGTAKVSRVCPTVITTGIGGGVPLIYNVYVGSNGSAVANAQVTSFTVNPDLEGETNYGLNHVYTDSEGRLYLWLPEGKHIESVTVLVDGTQTSYSTESVHAAAHISPSAISGYVDFGKELTAILENGNATKWKWQKHTSSGDWIEIDRATEQTFTPTIQDLGEIRVVINDIYTSSSVLIRSPAISVTVPTSMVVTINAAGECTVPVASICNNSKWPVYVTSVNFKWVTNTDCDANEIFKDYRLVRAALSLKGENYIFSGASPAISFLTDTNGRIAAMDDGTPVSLPLEWEFTLGTNNYLNLVPAMGAEVQVATVICMVSYTPPGT